MKPKGWSQLNEQDKNTLRRMFNHFETRRINRYALKECKEDIVAMALENQGHGQSFDELFPEGLEKFCDECVENTPRGSTVFSLIYYLSFIMLTISAIILCMHFFYNNSDTQAALLQTKIEHGVPMSIYIQNDTFYLTPQLLVQFIMVMFIYFVGNMLFAYYNLAKRKFAFLIMFVTVFVVVSIQNVMPNTSTTIISIPLSFFYTVTLGSGVGLFLAYHLLSKQQWIKEKAKRQSFI